jgi:poly(A)-specific ribonuclease
MISAVIDPKHTRYHSHEQPHEAGYDSLLTAKNFIRQATQLRDAFPGPSQLISKTPLPGSLNQTKSIGISSTKPSPDKDTPGSRFAHQNVFATLTDGDNEASDSDLASEFDGVTVANADNDLIPSFSSPIWKIYGNKLRVFGTYERVCILDG